MMQKIFPHRHDISRIYNSTISSSHSFKCEIKVLSQSITDVISLGKLTYYVHLYLYILGIWADEGSSDEERHPGFGGGGKNKNKDYTLPVSFVSGGIKEGDKVSTKPERTEDDDKYSVCMVRIRMILRVDQKCQYFQKYTKHTLFHISTSKSTNQHFFKVKNFHENHKISPKYWKCTGIKCFCHRHLPPPESVFCTP